MQKASHLFAWVAVVIVLLGICGLSSLLGALVIIPRTSTASTPPVAQLPALVADTAAEEPVTSEDDLTTAALEPTTTPVLPAYDPRFETRECPMMLPEGATIECGVLLVPEDRSNPEHRELELSVAIIRSLSPTPQPDPIFYLEGGPGGTATTSLGFWISNGFADNRDVIVIDQRGAGYSKPGLNCPEVGDWDKIYKRNLDEVIKDQVLICQRRLVRDKIRLSHYNSAANAQDVNELRALLGYEQINLLGISYGTRLALTIMRDYPEHIRSVVLDSTYPPQVDAFGEHAANSLRAFNALFEGCAVNPECNAAYPNLRNTFYTLVAQLNERPAFITVAEFESGRPLGFTISGNDLVNVLFGSLYDTSIIPFLPRLIANAANGDFYDIGFLFQYNALRSTLLDDSPVDGFSEGMYYSVQCHEEMPFANESQIEAAVTEFPSVRDYFVDNFAFEERLCNLWRVESAADLENEPVRSDIPTLVLAGQYDPITPPSWGLQAVEFLSTGYYYEFPGYGHGISILGGCPTNITLNFIDVPGTAPDGSCIGQIGGPDFALPNEYEFDPGTTNIALVTRGGNLRSQPELIPDTVLGQVCPGDSVVIFDQQQIGDVLWYYVVVDTTSVDCVPDRVPAGTEGWLSSLLLS